MLKPLRPCAKASCDELTRNTYCEKHKPKEAPRRESAEYHYMYSTKWWGQARYAHLLKSPFCVQCAKKNIRTKATEVDHVMPHRGNHSLFKDASNFQSLCRSCHSRKTQEEKYCNGTSTNTPPTKKCHDNDCF